VFYLYYVLYKTVVHNELQGFKTTKVVSDFMKKYLALIVLLLLVGCSVEESQIVVGGLFALTGYGSEWGEAELKGVTLAFEEYDDKFTLKVEDMQSDNKMAVLATQKLIDFDDVVGIVGSTWLESYQGAAVVANDRNVPMVTPSGSITALQNTRNYNHVFSTWYRTDSQVHELLSDMKSKDIDTIELFLGNEAYWEDFSNSFHLYSSDYNIAIIGESKFDYGTVDYRTSLAKVSADAIFFGLNGEQEVFSFLKQRKELLPEVVLYTESSIEGFAMRKDFDDVLDDIYMVSPAMPDEEFIEYYTLRWKEPPVLDSANAYDAAKLLLEAIDAVGTSSDEIVDYIRDNSFDTVTFGEVSFDEMGGVIGGDFQIKYLDNGSLLKKS
jgi:branched-chain amino acid transport system substrate-binding protein